MIPVYRTVENRPVYRYEWYTKIPCTGNRNSEFPDIYTVFIYRNCSIPIEKIPKLWYTAYRYYGTRYTAIPDRRKNSKITVYRSFRKGHTVIPKLRYTVYNGTTDYGIPFIPAITGIPSYWYKPGITNHKVLPLVLRYIIYFIKILPSSVVS